jgi:hypothetical protein
MPTATYTPLATVTLGTATASVTFSSIPATYRDLIVILNAQLSNSTARETVMRFNSDTGANYLRVYAFGDGSTTGSGADTLNNVTPLFLSNTRASSINHIMDYSATDKHKTVLTRSSNTASSTAMYAHRWANTAAITSISLAIVGDTYAAGSTFSLYGVIA